MPRTDEGEFELVLGNKQLLSVFFIVVVLLGVFFTMGYIVGRNSSRAVITEVASAMRPTEAEAGAPVVVEPEFPSGSAETREPARASAPERPSGLDTSGSGAVAEPAAAPPGEQASQAVRKPAPAQPPPRPARADPTTEPAPGQSFLQVAAVNRPEAELLLEVLGKQGLTGRLAPVPGQDLFRVLVGPIQDSAGLSKTRSQLEAAGFKSFPRRY